MWQKYERIYFSCFPVNCICLICYMLYISRYYTCFCVVAAFINCSSVQLNNCYHLFILLRSLKTQTVVHIKHNGTPAPVVKVREGPVGGGGQPSCCHLSPPAIVWAPLDWIYSVILCLNNAKLVGLEWVWGLLQPGFVRWAPLLHKTTLTTDLRRCVPASLCVFGLWSKRRQTNMATRQYGDTKMATNQNGDTAIRRRPERRQTETATSQNGDMAV